MPENAIAVRPFDETGFAAELVQAAGQGGPSSVPRQITYLAHYCRRLGARTVAREERYIDRHYIDEFAAYYSRSLVAPANYVKRFHLFSWDFDDDEFNRMLNTSMRSRDDATAVEGQLAAAYLGFISIRPIPSVPVGRTVLRRMADSGDVRRHIWATTRYDVHLANVRLTVDGLAFQQQDIAVGACATASLWSALSRVARMEGMRAPTPAEISEAASTYILAGGRSVPATGGLNVLQLSEAVRKWDFAPEMVRADSRPEVFVAALHAYLLSGIPVVLGLQSQGRGHAVTAIGFQIDTTPHPKLQTIVPARSSRLKKLYVHDDRLGPYARAFIEPFAHRQLGEGLLFKIESETWLIQSALAPVYPKLRLSVANLIALADRTGSVVEQVIEKAVGTGAGVDLTVEFFYERSGEFLGRLPGAIPTASSAAFLRSVALSRWCGVVRWHLAERPIVEFIYDTTDIVRSQERSGAELLRAVVCYAGDLRPEFQLVAQVYGVPFLGS